MRYIKPFNESREFPTDPQKIMRILREIAPDSSNNYPDSDVYIHPDGTVDVNGEHHLIITNLSNGRLPIKFGRVRGKFEFSSSGCRVTTLEGSPRECGGFICTKQPITSTKGIPKFIRDSLDLEGTKITKLEGLPDYLGGYFDVTDTNLTSLEGSPRTVDRFFCTRVNNIESLVGGPEVAEGYYKVERGDKLTSLEGAPKICGVFDVNSSQLWDPRPLKDCKITLIQFNNSPLRRLLSLFDARPQQSVLHLNVGRQKTIEDVTEMFLQSLDYNYIRGDVNDPQINLFRLREAWDEFDFDISDLPPAQVFFADSGKIKYRLVDDDGRSVNFDGSLI